MPQGCGMIIPSSDSLPSFGLMMYGHNLKSNRWDLLSLQWYCLCHSNWQIDGMRTPKKTSYHLTDFSKMHESPTCTKWSLWRSKHTWLLVQLPAVISVCNINVCKIHILNIYTFGDSLPLTVPCHFCATNIIINKWPIHVYLIQPLLSISACCRFQLFFVCSKYWHQYVLLLQSLPVSFCGGTTECHPQINNPGDSSC